MRRREFIAGLGSAAWPLMARAQQSVTPVVGFLGSANLTPDRRAAFRRVLEEGGYVEGRNLAIEFRSAEGRYDLLPALAADLVSRPVDVIFADAMPAARAAKAATKTIPIVFDVGGDPVQEGLVARLNRPEGNLTGATVFFGDVIAKRLQMLRELVPAGTVIGVLLNPSNPNVEFRLRELQEAAHSLGQQIQILNASSERDFDGVFATLLQWGAGALLVGDDPMFGAAQEQLMTLAARHAVPASYPNRGYVALGGLMAYGAVFTDEYRQGGAYVARILRGAKPADLPVAQPTRFELVINLKTAKALGLTVPQSILLRADEVIE
jgi:putative tryptophan/tyrosine transport system substrate-binding protein